MPKKQKPEEPTEAQLVLSDAEEFCETEAALLAFENAAEIKYQSAIDAFEKEIKKDMAAQGLERWICFLDDFDFQDFGKGTFTEEVKKYVLENVQKMLKGEKVYGN